MYNMNNIHRCNNCSSKWHTKKMYDLHRSMCDLVHQSEKERIIDREIEIPSQAAMFQYIVYLSNKCNDLEKKVAKIQSSTTRLRRKHIDEYLKNISPPKIGYSDWLSSIEVNYSQLQIVFDRDLEECIRQILSPLLSEIPIRAFIQKTCTFYIYDETEWRIMTADEFTSFVTSISRRILKTYTKWARENYEEMHSTTKMQELGMLYMKKVNGMDKSSHSRISAIKKWLFANIAVSLNNVDF